MMLLKWKFFTFASLFLISYVLFRRSFLRSEYKSTAEATLTSNYKDLSAKVAKMESINFDLLESVAELKKSQYAKLDQRKDEGIQSEVESLKRHTYQLRMSVNKVNQCLFGGYTLTAAYTSPQDKFKRRSGYKLQGKKTNRGIMKSSFDSDIELVSTSTIGSTPNENSWESKNIKSKSSLILDSSKIILTKEEYTSAKDVAGGNNANEDIKNKFKNSILEVIKDKKINNSSSSKPSEVLRVENKEPKPNLRYRDVVRFSSSGDKYKRVFIPGRGWVATKIIEDEESTLGNDAFVIEMK